jgi:hypothetical protein
LYEYDGKYDWELQAEKSVGMGETPPSKEDIEAELFATLEDRIIQKFAEEFGKKGRWVKVNSVSSTTTSYERVVKSRNLRAGITTYGYTFRGTSIINFETDVSPEEKGSIVTAISIILAAIGFALMAHPIITLIIVAVIVFTIVAIACRLAGVSLWTPVTPTGGGGEWVIAVIVLLLLFVALFFFIDKKGKRKK